MFLYFFMLGFYVYFIYPRKILILLSLEMFFLLALGMTFLISSPSNFNFFFIFLVLLVFLVVDSVTGISILVSIGRKSGPHSSWLF